MISVKIDTAEVMNTRTSQAVRRKHSSAVCSLRPEMVTTRPTELMVREAKSAPAMFASSWFVVERMGLFLKTINATRKLPTEPTRTTTE